MFLVLLVSVCPSHREIETLQHVMLSSHYHRNSQDSILCPSHRLESETLQHVMILFHYPGNNQDSMYELAVVYVEGTKVSFLWFSSYG